jgi:hypothetical protein
MNEKCLEILNGAPKNKAYLDFYYLDYMKGKCLLNKLDKNAGHYIKSFLTNFKGQHYIKEAYQRMAWYELIQNQNTAAYRANMSLCISKGDNLLDEDKQSLHEAKLGGVPDPSLLKARLFYDGGYYQEAEALLLSTNTQNRSVSFLVEYNYRIGRVYQALKKTEKALFHLGQSYSKGKKMSSYFACGSALQLGIIEEERSKYNVAKQYYTACLELEPEQYKSSLHQKAKSGLERLNKK